MTELQTPTAALPKVNAVDRTAGTLVAAYAFSYALVAYPKIKNKSASIIVQDVTSLTNSNIGAAAGTVAYGLGVAAIPASLVFGYLVARGLSRRVRHYYALRSAVAGAEKKAQAKAGPAPAAQ